MKNSIKTVVSRLVIFIACNLLTALIGSFAMLIAGSLAYQEFLASRNLTNLIFYVVITVGFIIPFYIFYFLKNVKYKRLYLNSSAEGHNIKSIMRMHINSFAKYELPIIFIISFVLSLIPTVVLAKSGISFLFASAGFFIDIVPVYLFKNTAFIFRLIGFVLWDIYIVIIYFACLRMAYRRWEKKRFKKHSNKG